MIEDKVMSRDEKVQMGVSQIQEKLTALRNEQNLLKDRRMITNCRLQTPDMSSNVNIRTAYASDLKYFRAKLSAVQRESEEDIYISGFSISDWIADIDYVLQFNNVTNEIVRLDRLQESLSEYYTDDRKISDNIDKLIGSI